MQSYAKAPMNWAENKTLTRKLCEAKKLPKRHEINT